MVQNFRLINIKFKFKFKHTSSADETRFPRIFINYLFEHACYSALTRGPPTPLAPLLPTGLRSLKCDFYLS